MKFEIPRKNLLKEGEIFTAVCRVIPLIDEYGYTKGFILKSVIGKVGEKKQEKQDELKLESFTEGHELI